MSFGAHICDDLHDDPDADSEQPDSGTNDEESGQPEGRPQRNAPD